MRCMTSRKQPTATLGQIQQINLASTVWPSTKREFTTPSLRVVQYTVTKNTWGGTLERSLSRDFARQPTRASCVRPTHVRMRPVPILAKKYVAWSGPSADGISVLLLGFLVEGGDRN